ncbi:MAG: hypothetical protein U5L45_04055 [Saprospiraceae bacterium]|nr:hypothetical protein [Saprospiraceae bacterium]
MVHFSGFARKMNHITLRASEASAKKNQRSLDFMYGFKTKVMNYNERISFLPFFILNNSKI